MDDVREIVARLTKEFGPGQTSGIHAILLHDSLETAFDKNAWDEWFFKPAPAAFWRAHSLGLIVPAGRRGKWSFTPLGLRVRASLVGERG